MEHKRVAHLVRKCLPPFTSFVRNQVMNHSKYAASIVYKEYIDSVLAREIVHSMPSFYCDLDKRGMGRWYSDLLYGRPFRRLTGADKRNIARFLAAERTDIVHYHYGTDAGVFLDAVPDHIPSVVSFYGYDCSSFPKWYLGLGTRYLTKVFEKVDYCLAMSDDMRSDLMALGCPEEKIIVHYHGISVGRFIEPRSYDEKRSIVLLAVGYLVPQKGHGFTLRALRQALDRTEIRMKLRIVGRGRLESRLKDHARRYGLLDNVNFVGPLDYLSPAFLGEFRNADVFIHPSVTSEKNEKEGIPGAIVEAMASALPVISTFHAGIPCVIRDHETGLLVKEWDIGGLTNAIVRMAESVDLRKRIGMAARKYAVEHLDLKNRQAELENIYDRVIHERRAGGRFHGHGM